MEKKRVRLYKAQEGGQPPVDMLGYPGSQQQEQQQLSEDQVLQMVVNDISQDLPKAAIVNKLVNSMGLEIAQANQYVESVYSALEQQKSQASENEETADEEEIQENQTEGELVQEEDEDEPMKDIQGHTDLAMEEEEGEEEYLTDLEDENMMRYGGALRMQDGGEYEDMPVVSNWDESAYPIYFPGMESYLPAIPYEYSNDAADIAWQEPVFEQTEEDEVDYTTPVAEPSEFRYGGYKSKKGYVNNVLKLVRKQLGGDQETSSDDTDPRGEDYRTSHLDAFLGSIKKEGNIAIAKEKAEKEYDQAMQQYEMMMSPQQEALNQYIPQDYEIPEAQFGMEVPQGFRNQRQYRRFMRNLPMNAGQGMPAISKIDVHRSGLFGRPRRYSVEFDNSPLKALAANPMMPGIYGYGFGTQTTRTPARVITETVTNTVNNEATKEVAAATNSEAATTSATNGATTNTSTQANPVSGGQTPAATTPVAGTGEVSVTSPSVVTSEEKVTKTKGKEDKEDKTKYIKHTDTKTNINYYYDPKGKKWYRGDSKKLITDKNSIKNLENWVGAKTNAEMNRVLAEKANRDMMHYNIHGKPQSILADDELISTVAFMGAGSLGSGAARSIPAQFEFTGAPQGALNAGRAALNTGQRMLNTGQRMLNPGQRMLNPGQRLLNPPGGYQYTLPFEEGGFVDSANPELYRFVYGGNDPSIPELTQGDIDDVYSKDTSDAYFQRGGARQFISNYFPANINPQYYAKYMGTRGAQGMPMAPQFGPNTMIRSIDVKKSGLFGQPKRYSINFTNPEMDPTKQNIITLDSNAPQTLSAKDLRRNEKQAGRQRPIHVGKKYEKYFEDAPSSQQDIELAKERQAKYDRIAEEQRQIADSVANMLRPKSPQKGMTQDQIQQVQSMLVNQSGLPEYSENPSGNTFIPNYVQRNPKYGSSAQSYESYVDFYNSGKPLEPGMTRAPMYTRDQYANMFGHYERGGALRKFIPQAQYGADTPVVYTNNPALAGLSDVDIISMNPGIPGLGTPSWAEPMPGAAQSPKIQDTGAVQPKQYTEDPMQANRNVTKKTFTPGAGDFEMDYKLKKKGNIQSEILAANAAIEGVTGMINRFNDRDREAKMYQNLTSDNLFAQQTSTDRGDYDTNSGLYRPDEQGQTWNSRSAQFGGSMDPYSEGAVVDMTEEELEEFLANGGQVEYL